MQELLEGRGVQQKAGEKFGDVVARELGISARQTEILLEALHDGHDVDDAVRAAEIDPTAVSGDLLVQLGSRDWNRWAGWLRENDQSQTMMCLADAIAGFVVWQCPEETLI